MDNFKRNNKFGGRRNGGRFSGRSSGRPAIMHKAVCSACGKECEVPFKPTGDKPIFCADCFRNKRNDGSRRFSGKDFGRPDSGNRRMYKAICDKCGKECEVPFKPTSDKPIYCNECFNKRGKDRSSDEANKQQASRQFEIINAKLDEILKAISSIVLLKENGKKKTAKETGISKSNKASKSKGKKVASLRKAKGKKKK